MGANAEKFSKIRGEIGSRGASFVARKNDDGRVVISDVSPTFRQLSDFDESDPSKEEEALRSKENVTEHMSLILNLASKGVLLAATVAVGYGAGKKSPGTAYGGLVIGGCIAAELKFLSWFLKTEANLIRRRRDVLEALPSDSS